MILVIRIWIIGYCFGFSISSQNADKIRPKDLKPHCSSVLTGGGARSVMSEVRYRLLFSGGCVIKEDGWTI